MNRIYSLVFNRSLGRMQVASELAARRQTCTGNAPRIVKTVSAAMLVVAMAAGPAAAQVAPGQLPTGGTVVGGIDGIDVNGNTMTISQNGGRAVIRWNTFDVGADALVRFVQQTGDIALNQILDVDASQIMGNIDAAGTVFLVNPNGILFGAGAQVNVGGLIASTLTMQDPADFLDESVQVLDLGYAGQRGAVINRGTINAGQVTLLGANLHNSGTISVGSGGIDMAVADGAQLSLVPGAEPRLTTTTALGGTVGGAAGIQNTGTLAAGPGSHIALQVAAAPGLMPSAINHTGVLQAGGVMAGADGTVSLVAVGGGINIAGTVQAGMGQTVVSSDGAVSFGANLDTGSLSVSANSVSQSTGALRTTDLTLIVTTNDITLGNTGNAFGGTVSLWARNAIVRNATMLRFGTLDVASLQADAPQLRLSGSVHTLGLQAYSGDLLLERDTQLTSDYGDIHLNGNVDGAFALRVAAAGQARLGGNVDSGTALASLDTRGSGVTWLGGNLTTSGDLQLGGTRVGSGNYTVRSTAGSVAVTGGLDGAANGQGQLTLVARDAVSLGADAGASARLQSLTLEGASVSTRGVRVTDALTLDASQGLQMQSAVSGGRVTLRSGDDINLLHDVGATQWLTLVGGGDILQQGGTLTTPRLDVESGGFSTLGMLGNQVGALGNIRTADGFTFGNALAITQLAGTTLDVGGSAEINAGTADIVLDNALNAFAGPVFLQGGRISVRSAGDLRLGALGSGLNRNVRLVAGGSLELDTPGAIDTGTGALTLASNGGALSVNRALSGGDLHLTGRDGITVGADIRAGGTLELHSNQGAIIQTGGALTVAGASNIDAGTGAITLANAGNDFAGVVNLQGGTVTIRDANALALGNLATGNLTAVSTGALGLGTGSIAGMLEASSNGGAITQAGALTVAGASSIDAGTGAITLANAGNDFAGVVNLQGGTVAIRDANALALGNLATGNLTAVSSGALSLGAGDIDGRLAASSNGSAINQTGALAVAGASNIDAGTGSITLANAGNDFAGVVNLQGGDVAINDANHLQLGALNATRASANAAGDLVLTGEVHAQGDIAVSSGGRFINQAGAQALHSVNGRWLVHLGTTGDQHQYNGLDSGHVALLGVAGVGDVTATGNRYAFAERPTLTLTTTDLSKFYGEAADLGNVYTVDGLLGSVDGAYLGHALADVLTGTPVPTSAGAATTASVSGGPYAIEIDPTGLSANGYALQVVNAGTLTIDRATLTIAASDADKIYGQLAGLTGYTVNGLVNNDSVGSVDLASSGSATTANVGQYAITVDGADGVGLDNYDITYVGGTLTVGRAGLTITANDADKVYGELAGLTGYTVDGLVNNDSVGSVDLASGGSATTANVGQYAITVDGADGVGLDNYDITYVDGTLTVGRAGLTITANDADKIYGQLAGLTGYTVNGLVNNDSVGSVDLVSNGTATTANVGQYAITVDGADGVGLDNYDITYVGGTLTVGRAGLTIIASDADKIYGQFAGLTGYTVNGLVNNDSVGSVDLASSGSATTANVGQYAITVDGADGVGLDNYDITYVDGTLTVGRAGLTITASDVGKPFGSGIVLDGYSVEGLVNDDRVDDVSLSSDGSGWMARPGQYPIIAIDAVGAGLGNYEIAYVDGALTVGTGGIEPVTAVALDVAASLIRSGDADDSIQQADTSTADLYRIEGAGIRQFDDMSGLCPSSSPATYCPQDASR